MTKTQEEMISKLKELQAVYTPEGLQAFLINVGLNFDDLVSIIEQQAEEISSFKIYGTDDCITCDEGRITLLHKHEECIECRHKRKRADKALKDKP